MVIAILLLARQRPAPDPRPVAAAPVPPSKAAPPPEIVEPKPSPMESPARTAAPPPRPAPAVRTEPALTAAVTTAPAGTAPARDTPPPEPKAERAAPAKTDRETWRVIAYTYNRYEHARSKVQTINRVAPGLHATVFTPKGSNRPPYLISLGGRMTREEALAVQKKAWAQGLPRDTFVQNYSN
jgi:hypothetical protein